MPKILGILNLTKDSFSDGGRYIDPSAAIEHAHRLVADGAAMIDIGAESTHPDAESVPDADQIARLTPVITALRGAGIPVSVDTHRPAVMRATLALGVDCINDVSGMSDAASIAAVRDSTAKLIVMHSASTTPRATRDSDAGPEIVATAVEFLRLRTAALTTAGIRPDRIIIDPGMGFFLSRRPEASFAVLRSIPRFRELGYAMCICTSRKSFLAGMSAQPTSALPVAQRGPATLATELWAASLGVEYIRTHDVAALSQALRTWTAITASTAVNP